MVLRSIASFNGSFFITHYHFWTIFILSETTFGIPDDWFWVNDLTEDDGWLSEESQGTAFNQSVFVSVD